MSEDTFQIASYLRRQIKRPIGRVKWRKEWIVYRRESGVSLLYSCSRDDFVEQFHSVRVTLMYPYPKPVKCWRDRLKFTVHLSYNSSESAYSFWAPDLFTLAQWCRHLGGNTTSPGLDCTVTLPMGSESVSKSEKLRQFYADRCTFQSKSEMKHILHGQLSQTERLPPIREHWSRRDRDDTFLPPLGPESQPNQTRLSCEGDEARNEKQYVIEASGQAGLNGQDGISGEPGSRGANGADITDQYPRGEDGHNGSPGLSGQDGQFGGRGQDGNNILVELYPNETHNRMCDTTDYNDNAALVDVYINGTAYRTLHVKGHCSAPGSDPEFVEFIHIDVSGGPGGCGGHGGHGGPGGVGGCGGGGGGGTGTSICPTQSHSAYDRQWSAPVGVGRQSAAQFAAETAVSLLDASHPHQNDWIGFGSAHHVTRSGNHSSSYRDRGLFMDSDHMHEDEGILQYALRSIALDELTGKYHGNKKRNPFDVARFVQAGDGGSGGAGGQGGNGGNGGDGGNGGIVVVVTSDPRLFQLVECVTDGGKGGFGGRCGNGGAGGSGGPPGWVQGCPISADPVEPGASLQTSQCACIDPAAAECTQCITQEASEHSYQRMISQHTESDSICEFCASERNYTSFSHLVNDPTEQYSCGTGYEPSVESNRAMHKPKTMSYSDYVESGTVHRELNSYSRTATYHPESGTIHSWNGQLRMVPGHWGYPGMAGLLGQCGQPGLDGQAGTVKFVLIPTSVGMERRAQLDKTQANKKREDQWKLAQGPELITWALSEFAKSGIVYDERFKVNVVDFELKLPGELDFIEPNACFTIENIRLQNASSMPLPVGAELALEGDSMIRLDQVSTIQLPALKPDELITLSQVLHCRTQDTSSPPQPGFWTRTISFRLYVCLLGRRLSQNNSQKELLVHNPIRMNNLKTRTTISPTEVAELSFQVLSLLPTLLKSSSATTEVEPLQVDCCIRLDRRLRVVGPQSVGLINKVDPFPTAADAGWAQWKVPKPQQVDAVRGTISVSNQDQSGAGIDKNVSVWVQCENNLELFDRLPIQVELFYRGQLIEYQQLTIRTVPGENPSPTKLLTTNQHTDTNYSLGTTTNTTTNRLLRVSSTARTHAAQRAVLITDSHMTHDEYLVWHSLLAAVGLPSHQLWDVDCHEFAWTGKMNDWLFVCPRFSPAIESYWFRPRTIDSPGMKNDEETPFSNLQSNANPSTGRVQDIYRPSDSSFLTINRDTMFAGPTLNNWNKPSSEVGGSMRGSVYSTRRALSDRPVSECTRSPMTLSLELQYTDGRATYDSSRPADILPSEHAWVINGPGYYGLPENEFPNQITLAHSAMESSKSHAQGGETLANSAIPQAVSVISPWSQMLLMLLAVLPTKHRANLIRENPSVPRIVLPWGEHLTISHLAALSLEAYLVDAIDQPGHKALPCLDRYEHACNDLCDFPRTYQDQLSVYLTALMRQKKAASASGSTEFKRQIGVHYKRVTRQLKSSLGKKEYDRAMKLADVRLRNPEEHLGFWHLIHTQSHVLRTS